MFLCCCCCCFVFVVVVVVVVGFVGFVVVVVVVAVVFLIFVVVVEYPILFIYIIVELDDLAGARFILFFTVLSQRMCLKPLFQHAGPRGVGCCCSLLLWLGFFFESPKT